MNPRLTYLAITVLAVLGGYTYFFETPSAGPLANTPAFSVFGPTYGEYDLTGLALTGPQGQALFWRTSAAYTRDWEMVGPTPVSADQLDQARVNGAVTRLGRLTANQVITGATNLAQYGLNPPELTVTLTISNGQTLLLYTGAPAPVNNSAYVRTGSSGQTVYLVPDLAVTELRRLLTEPPLHPLQ
jgi:hypothetical protein